MLEGEVLPEGEALLEASRGNNLSIVLYIPKLIKTSYIYQFTVTVTYFLIFGFLTGVISLSLDSKRQTV